MQSLDHPTWPAALAMRSIILPKTRHVIHTCPRLQNLQVWAIVLKLLTPVLLATCFPASPHSSLINPFGIYRSEWVRTPSPQSWVVAHPSYLLTASKFLSKMRFTSLALQSYFTAFGLIFSNVVPAYLELWKLVWWCTSLLLWSWLIHPQIVIWPMSLCNALPCSTPFITSNLGAHPPFILPKFCLIQWLRCMHWFLVWCMPKFIKT